MSKIKGIFAASMSVLNQDLTLNVTKTVEHAEKLIDQGCHGAAIFGSTGQAQLIPISEKISLFNQLASSKYNEKFIIGTGLNSLGETINLMKVARSLNFKKFPKQIIGVKDSSYNLFENLKLDNFSVLPGSESKLLKGLELGCSGIITATCNVSSAMARKVYDDFFNKKEQTINQKLCDVRNTFEKYNLISALHSYYSKKDSIYKNVLPPLSILSPTDKKELTNNLEKLNFI